MMFRQDANGPFRYSILVRPQEDRLEPDSNGLLRVVSPWDRQVGDSSKKPGALYVGHIVTHLSVEEWCAMHHYDLVRVSSSTNDVSPHDRTVIQSA
jgi:hypothetical protein